MQISRVALLRSSLPQALWIGSQAFWTAPAFAVSSAAKNTNACFSTAALNDDFDCKMTIQSMTPEALVGKPFDIVYSSEQSKDTYRFTAKTDAKIRWDRIAGSDVGKGDDEDYVITQLDPENILVTWIEADGLGLSNVLNFKAKTCLTHGNNKRNAWKHTGDLTLVEQISAPSKAVGEGSPSVGSSADLVGKTFDIVYSSEQSKDTYRFKVQSADKIRWDRIAGSDVGKGDLEQYVATRLDDDKLIITWIEADGLGLTNVLNFKAGTCLTHGNNGRSVWKHTGALSLVEGKKVE